MHAADRPTPLIDAVGVVIPARNEADHIAAALRAVDAAAARVGVAVTIALVLDDCHDDTADVVAGVALSSIVGLRILPVQLRSVGAARAAGAALLLAHLGADHVWLASTDADSVVPPHWLSRHLELAREGAELVCGTVSVTDWRPWSTHTRQSYETAYRKPLQADGHGHIHGANLGIRAITYAQVGGFPATSFDEDVDLVTAAVTAGHCIVWADDIPVMTSARPHARAPHGFSTHLHTHTADSGSIATKDQTRTPGEAPTPQQRATGCRPV